MNDLTLTFAISLFKAEFLDLSRSNSACNCTTYQDKLISKK